METLAFVGSIIIGLIILVFLVVVHELGHAVAARRNGVVVEEFGIGFPPRAWARKLKNGVLFTLNWLPLGGFVKLKGEHDQDSGEGSYGHSSLWAKVKILLAGVVVNWLVAALIFTVLALIGMPKILPGQFSISGDTTITRDHVVATNVIKDSPADEAGLKSGDEILRLGDSEIKTTDDLYNATRNNAGHEIEVRYLREDSELVKKVTLNEESDPDEGYFGVAPGQSEYIKATWSAPIVGVGTTVQFSAATIQGIGDILSNLSKGLASKFSSDEATREAGAEAIETAQSGFAGPVGIFGQIFPAAISAGVVPLLYVSAIISLTLAVMNALPIPALDGGRVFLTLLFRIMRKPLTKELEEKINAIGFIALMALVILITVVDIGRIAN